MLEKGILIFALGHPYYGRYAYNLSVTIKAVENIPVAVVHDSTSLSHLDDYQKRVFDKLVICNLKPGCGAKLHAYELSPFENTLLLDADMLWLPVHTPSELLESLSGIEFTGITEGSTDNPSSHYFFWAKIEEIREKYQITGTVHQWRTEVVYFEKSDKVKEMFSDAV